MKTKIRTLPQPSNPYEALVFDKSLAENIINYKRLHIDINPSQVSASYDVYLRKDHPLFFRAERDWSTRGAQRLSNEVLGAVSVAHEFLKFERIQTSIADTDERAHLNVTSGSFRHNSNRFSVAENIET